MNHPGPGWVWRDMVKEGNNKCWEDDGTKDGWKRQKADSFIRGNTDTSEGQR